MLDAQLRIKSETSPPSAICLINDDDMKAFWSPLLRKTVSISSASFYSCLPIQIRIDHRQET